jgi:type I restriction enzyme S subunit
MRFEQTKLMAGWLSLAYQHDSGQRQIAARAVGTTMANLNTDLLNHLVFAFPPIEEQEMVVSVAAEAGKRIAAARDELAKLKMLRAGLTDDLLTGIVRVPEALDERELA